LASRQAKLYRDPAAAQNWWEQAAAAAGNADAMLRIGALLEEDDPEAARDWWQQAVEPRPPGATAGAINYGSTLTTAELPDPQTTNRTSRKVEANDTLHCPAKSHCKNNLQYATLADLERLLRFASIRHACL
jgi:TPR repeat protein